MEPTENVGLRIKLLGRFEVWREGALLAPEAWPQVKTQVLLKLLISERGKVFTKDQVLEALFPELDPQKASHNLHGRLSELRRMLEPHLKKGTNSKYIQSSGRQGYFFNKEISCEVDIEAFSQHIERAQVAEGAQRWAEGVESYQKALDLYTGDYLPEDAYEEWTIAPREHWREICLNALLGQAECQARLGQYAQAIEQCKKAVAVKSTLEAAYRQQMLYHYMLGEPGEALRIYQACVKALQEQVNVPPSAATRQLHEEISQNKVQGMSGVYPPPQKATLVRDNLPSALTSFIGRERELAEIKRLLSREAQEASPRTRLVTLTGAGGSGKTRLALQVAAEMRQDFPDGVWWVELASLMNPSLVAQAVAAAVGVKEEPGRSLLGTLTGSLKSKCTLLVLDNCEHVVQEAAQLVATLLRECPHLQVLTTSREALAITGEVSCPVPVLALPEERGLLPPLRILQEYEAVKLFVERAAAVQPGFALTKENAPALVEVCWRVDGIPLAIELAATRVKHLSVEQIAARLDDRFKLLSSGSRTAMPRQQTLKATIDWGFNLLTEQEQTLLRRLSVLAGGFELEAAEAVCADARMASPEILDLLASLVDKSFVIREARSQAARYKMLQTIRQYAWDKLRDSGEIEVISHRHLEYFLTLAEQAESGIRGARGKESVTRLELELDNIRIALDWAWKAEPESGVRLAGALGWFWDVRGYWAEGRKVLHLALEHRADPLKKWRAKVLRWEAQLVWRHGNYGEAIRLGEESRALYQELGNKKGVATSLRILGLILLTRGDLAEARRYFQESLTLECELGDKRGMAATLHNLANVATSRGDYPEARRFHQESLLIKREIGDKRGIAGSLNGLGQIAIKQGEYAQACDIIQESLAIKQELGDRRGIAVSLLNLGTIAAGQGAYAEAHRFYQKNLTMMQELGDKLGIAECLETLADLARLQKEAERSSRLFGAAEALRERMGATLAPAECAEYERNVAAARAALGDAAFGEAQAKGRAMTLEQAIKYALESK
jgi:predicted ATPase/DNA-binding SARP family transcriptional activator